jgi:replicative DNA helicase
MVKDFVPDIVIIDYADIMRSTHHYNDRRFELDAIYNQVRNLGIEFKVPIVTATQLNRSALERLESGKILTESNIAESYGIARIVDAGVTINSTPVDSSLHHISTIYVFKNRDGESGESWKMYVDFSRALVREYSAPLISDITDKMKKKDK